MTEVATVAIPQSVIAEIDREIAKYPDVHQRSAVMAALRLVQEHNAGSLTDALIAWVADYLSMPKVAVLEVATFYSMYFHQPVGEHVISLCKTLPCQLKGCQKIEAYLKQKLDVDVNGTTADGKFTLKKVECLGACVGAPMMQVDKTYHENLTPEKIDQILEGLK